MGERNSQNTKIVYDCMEENSPYYEKTNVASQNGLAEGPYIDEQDNVDMGIEEG